jgi:hypothetical protein
VQKNRCGAHARVGETTYSAIAARSLADRTCSFMVAARSNPDMAVLARFAGGRAMGRVVVPSNEDLKLPKLLLSQTQATIGGSCLEVRACSAPAVQILVFLLSLVCARC